MVCHPYSLAEWITDGVIHALGVILVLVAAAVLLHLAIADGGARLIIGSAVYASGLVACFGFSAAYNLTLAPRWRALLRRFDHAAIYLMIAGTYTPLSLICIGGTVGTVLLALVWSVALVGVTLKLIWPHRFEKLSLVLYLSLGWIGLVVIGRIIDVLPVPALILLLAGGLFYTFGVVFHLWSRLPFQNAIWHGFVLTAACFHYAAVLDSIFP
ncbi:PAQR family membrane homeostasis protein TrhA [Phaeospirillum tilakii]|uniref:Hemolysin III family protein n=1 Tax=Phaeospirillum tilakii TaxID=741673 RepID=A0ABW5CDJ4_9PROT